MVFNRGGQRRDRGDGDSDDDGDCGNNHYADYYGPATAMWWLHLKEEIWKTKGDGDKTDHGD